MICRADRTTHGCHPYPINSACGTLICRPQIISQFSTRLALLQTRYNSVTHFVELRDTAPAYQSLNVRLKASLVNSRVISPRLVCSWHQCIAEDVKMMSVRLSFSLFSY